jgi:hypothetical protein
MASANVVPDVWHLSLLIEPSELLPFRVARNWPMLVPSPVYPPHQRSVPKG